ncbi:hypothetical protein E8F11_17075 [Pseudomonas sp. BN417]|uniref:hypothetical protein n=1 Tax=Pseudomonas sp. BN417 TaxID=2567890 RepID=UPI002458A425|nr:hypothetical protein [Pseudomonas sp. BN417]MDH4556857.1 hypothetical protein [Pseudomonas sp. BN417]
MAWQQCPVCHGSRAILKNGYATECRYCRGLGKVYESTSKSVTGGLFFQAALQVLASLAAGYLAAEYEKQWDPTDKLILGALVAAAVYWCLTLKVFRELLLWGMALVAIYHVYEGWIHR